MSENNAAASKPSIRTAGTRTPRKPKKNQIPIGMLIVLLMAAVGIALSFHSPSLGFFWVTGSVFGFILQRSRFCFTASVRDPIITGSTSVTRAVLIALAVTTVMFTAIKYGAQVAGLPIPGSSFVVPISLATAVGAFMFGIGMVIAGGCASGTLMRVGEGFGMQFLSLLFFVGGSLLGASHYGWWMENFIVQGPKVFLPDIFGWMGAVVVQLLIIFCLYRAAVLWEKKKLGSEEE